MQRMVDDWEPILFNTTLYRDSGNVLLYFRMSTTFKIIYPFIQMGKYCLVVSG